MKYLAALALTAGSAMANTASFQPQSQTMTSQQYQDQYAAARQANFGGSLRSWFPMELLPSLDEGYVGGLLMSFFLVLGLTLTLDLVFSGSNILKVLTLRQRRSARAQWQPDQVAQATRQFYQAIDAISQNIQS